jgi:hypothetical protein
MRLTVPVRNASIAAICLLALAALIAFIFKPGPLTLVIFPGMLPASILAGIFYKLPATAQRLIYWVLLLLFNFGWYWLISYAALRTSRAVNSRQRFSSR